MIIQLRGYSNTGHFYELLLKIRDEKYQETEWKINLPIGLGTRISGFWWLVPTHN